MSVLLIGDAIALRGACGVEEAETLLGLIQEHPNWPIDLAAAGVVHTALWQVILALKPPLRGEPADPFIRKWLLPALKSASAAAST